jgi:hypothetical protein
MIRRSAQRPILSQPSSVKLAAVALAIPYFHVGHALASRKRRIAAAGASRTNIDADDRLSRRLRPQA